VELSVCSFFLYQSKEISYKQSLEITEEIETSLEKKGKGRLLVSTKFSLEIFIETGHYAGRKPP
jgi:hypothetical protein